MKNLVVLSIYDGGYGMSFLENEEITLPFNEEEEKFKNDLENSHTK